MVGGGEQKIQKKCNEAPIKGKVLFSRREKRLNFSVGIDLGLLVCLGSLNAMKSYCKKIF
jgi:hypothetical protein